MRGEAGRRGPRRPARGLLGDRRGAVFAEYVIVFGLVGLVFMAAVAAIATSYSNSYYWKMLFMAVDGIQ